MNYLSIERYNEEESKALLTLPNSVITSFRPEVFKEVGFPDRVKIESELFKYVDSMHDGRFESDFERMLGGAISQEEFELVKEITKTAYTLSERHFAIPVVPRAALLRQVNIFRHIRYVSGNDRPRVFEIGAGSGYLGALLIKNGFPYAATDVCQAFYLYQNRLWQECAGGKLIDLAENSSDFTAKKENPLHIPWWKFCRLRAHSIPEFDIITCNHAWVEMNSQARLFNLRVCKEMLLRGNGLKAMVFEGFGWHPQTTLASVMEDFYRMGFVLLHHDTQITLFALKGSPLAYGGMDLPRMREEAKLIVAEGQVSAEIERLPSFELQPFSSPQNQLSSSVMALRLSNAKECSVPRSSLETFYEQLSGVRKCQSPDEEFLDFSNCSS